MNGLSVHRNESNISSTSDSRVREVYINDGMQEMPPERLETSVLFATQLPADIQKSIEILSASVAKLVI